MESRLPHIDHELDGFEQDLEFASGMVMKLNMILITSPELAEFRRRLKSLETRVRAAFFTCLS